MKQLNRFALEELFRENTNSGAWGSAKITNLFVKLMTLPCILNFLLGAFLRPLYN